MLTGVVLAKNEEAVIVEALASLRPHVEELILIDMESADRTVELARPYVDRIVGHPTIRHFDAARNCVIESAKHDWLWYLDADERVPAATGRLVRDLIRDQGESFQAVSIPFKSYFCGKWIQHCGWWPGYTMPRVLRRGRFRFSDRLHGGVVVDGREVRIPPDPDLGIDHFSYRSITHYLEKLNRYTSGEADHLAADGVRFDWRESTRAWIRDLWLYYERNQGRSDDVHGWILSWLAGQYRWLSHAKLLDSVETSESRRDSPSVPRDLDEFLAVARRELQRLRRGGGGPPASGVVLRSPVRDPSGYAEEGRLLLQLGAALDRDFQLQEIRWSPVDAVQGGLRTAIELCAKAPRPDHPIVVTNCIAGVAAPDPDARVNVLRTTFECDRVPAAWLPHLQAYDQLWVMTEHDRRAFVASGAAPEKIRVVSSCIDVELYRPDGPRVALPVGLSGRFVFLSIFDWQIRKGWDVLLRAYVSEFSPGDGTSLLLKITRNHGHSVETVRDQVGRILESCGQRPADRPDVVLWEALYTADEMAGLYRSVDAFVMASRGEGWGRPYMEAMASGLPTIGTRGSGNLAFMTDANSFLVDAALTPVSQAAVDEIPTFGGLHWFEPSEAALRRQMRRVRQDVELRSRVGRSARAAMIEGFSLESGRAALLTALAAVDEGACEGDAAPGAPRHRLRVALEGEVFAGHSFANVNERLAVEFLGDATLDFRIRRRIAAPTREPFGHESHLLDCVGDFDETPDVVIRHAFPPDWSELRGRKWVHIQPWEFGHLPVDWIEPLRDRVDEIWAPSRYVADVYVRSGVPREKIQVIPWGVKPELFTPAGPRRELPTPKSFRFLFCGGAIQRKGFDLVLDAYLAEFTPADDVCLVVKDVGAATFYRGASFRDAILAAAADPTQPAIVYLDDEMTEEQIAGLYRACHCLTAPYRGEGFGLPILEAMACGLPPIVPRGGPTDDFVPAEAGYFLETRTIETQHPWALVGPAQELLASATELRRVMRRVYSSPAETRARGEKAAESAKRMTWAATAAMMRARMAAICRPAEFGLRSVAAEAASQAATPPSATVSSASSPELVLAACLRIDGRDEDLPRRLCELRLMFDRTVVLAPPTSRAAAIAAEYEAHVLPLVDSESDVDALRRCAGRIAADWCVFVPASLELSPNAVDVLRSALRSCGNESAEVRLTDGGQAFWVWRGLGPCGPAAPQWDSAWNSFKSRLGKRALGFHAMFQRLDRLDRPEVTIVETGCVRGEGDWGAGQSTILFDSYVAHRGGRVVSVDVDAANCRHARGRVGAQTRVVEGDSVKFLRELAKSEPQSVDLLYLDSFDLDWNSPHESALHHLQELCAALPALRPGATVFIDDHCDELGRLGKSLYVLEFMRRIRASVVYEGYQIGWTLDDS